MYESTSFLVTSVLSDVTKKEIVLYIFVLKVTLKQKSIKYRVKSRLGLIQDSILAYTGPENSSTSKNKTTDLCTSIVPSQKLPVTCFEGTYNVKQQVALMGCFEIGCARRIGDDIFEPKREGFTVIYFNLVAKTLKLKLHSQNLSLGRRVERLKRLALLHLVKPRFQLGKVSDQRLVPNKADRHNIVRQHRVDSRKFVAAHPRATVPLEGADERRRADFTPQLLVLLELSVRNSEAGDAAFGRLISVEFLEEHGDDDVVERRGAEVEKLKESCASSGRRGQRARSVVDLEDVGADAAALAHCHVGGGVMEERQAPRGVDRGQERVILQLGCCEGHDGDGSGGGGQLEEEGVGARGRPELLVVEGRGRWGSENG